MSEISKEKILSSSSAWVASTLNFLPGLGVGYIYQRRWLPYFLTILSVTLWFILGIYFQGINEPTRTEQIIGISGLTLISIVTSIESNYAHKKATTLLINLEKKDEKIIKKFWFF